MPEAVLYHFSEDPSITRFEPHVAATSSLTEPLVWGLEPAKSYLYLFPRDCPRVTFYIAEHTSDADIGRFFGHTDATRVVAIESDWLERLNSTTLYRYELPAMASSCTTRRRATGCAARPCCRRGSSRWAT